MSEKEVIEVCGKTYTPEELDREIARTKKEVKDLERAIAAMRERLKKR